MLFALFNAPHYFRRAGKGRFRKASSEVIQQALVAIEKKKQQALQVGQWAQELAAGTCPAAHSRAVVQDPVQAGQECAGIQAVVEASRASHKAPLDLLQQAGAIDSPYQFHWRRFLLENFPKGTGFPPGLEAPAIPDLLPLAPVQAFSIDDSATTEIDDALSVAGPGAAAAWWWAFTSRRRPGAAARQRH